MKRNKRVFRILVLLLCLLMCIAPMLSCAVKAEERKTVRVAYALFPSFQEGKEGEYKSGYGYEYLQKIASITGWDFEYVYGSFTELLAMLEEGEVDLMGDLSYTQERAEHILYGSYEQGKETYYIYTHEDGLNLDVADISALNGKRVGVSAGSRPLQVFREWCAAHDVDCTIVEYELEQDRIDALNYGLIDAAVDRELLQESETEGWEVLTDIGTESFYFGVNAQRPDLLSELNEAQGRILADDPYYNEELQERCVRQGSMKAAQLNAEEENWLSEHDYVLKVGYLNNLLPYSTAQEGQFIGVGADLFDEMTNKYSANAIEIQSFAYETYEELLNALVMREVDCVWPVSVDAWSADQRNLLVSVDVLTTGMMLVFNDQTFEVGAQNLGILDNGSLEEEYAKIHYGDDTVVHLSSLQKAMEALKREEINSLLMSSLVYNIADKDALSSLDAVNLQSSVRVGFAVNKDDTALLQILNKGIYAMGETSINRSLIEHSKIVETFSMKQYFEEHPGRAMLTVGAIGLLLLLIVYRIMHERLVLSRKEKEVYQRLSMLDVLSGVGNRRAYEERIEEITKHPKAYRNICLVVFDINGLKRINDVYGRSEGDMLIQKAANVLKEEYGNDIYRISGDEFALFDHKGKEEYEVVLLSDASGETVRLFAGWSPLFTQEGNARTKQEWKKEADLSLYEHKISKKARNSHSEEEKLRTFIRGVRDVVDAKDAYTADHSARVSAIADLIGEKMGLSEVTLSRLNDAAELHDIGKIGIPDFVLQKPGRLTDEEFNIMKKHTIFGASILADSTGWLEVAQIVRHHHERFDGKGYPDGLKQTEIPIESRIIAVADSIDAMSSNRCYRNARPMEEVKKEIEKNLGTMYDPAIGNIALAHWDEIEKIIRRENVQL